MDGGQRVGVNDRSLPAQSRRKPVLQRLDQSVAYSEKVKQFGENTLFRPE